MILVDSCVLIDYLKTPTIERLNRFLTSNACMIGVIRAECLTGEKDATRRQRLEIQLEKFIQHPIPELLWDRVGWHRTLLQSTGINVPFNDIVIATTAMHYAIPVWTHDKQFEMMQSVFPKLNLFDDATP